MKQALVDLARSHSAIDAINKGLIRCGFELEFHACNDSADDAEIDHDRLDEDARERVTSDEIIDALEYENNDAHNIVVGLEALGVSVFEAAQTISNSSVRNVIRDAVQAAYESCIENERDWLINNQGHNYTESNDCRDYVDIGTGISDLIEYVSDSSVRGGELRTIGGLTPSKFMAVLSQTLEDNTFEIDEGCSFHIHISVPGVKHSYGQSFQNELQLFILDNFHRLPESVRARAVHDKGREYASFQTSKAKYSAVNFHDSGTTWEFRIFGNVTTESEARKCLLLAIDAMRHAYRVKLNISAPLSPVLGVATFNSILNEVNSGKSLKTIARQSRASVGA